MSIHTFGDSHSKFGWPDYVQKHHIGPILCYSFGKDPLGRCDIRKLGVKKGDTLIFCFGEIDCRCHIYKHCNEDDPDSYKKQIEFIVENYVKAIETVTNASNLRFEKICIYNVVPPVRKAITSENPAFPFLGTDEERRSYVLYFNTCIKKACEKNGYLFFNIFSNYCDSEYFLNKKLSDRGVHIGNGKYIEEFIKENLLPKG